MALDSNKRCDPEPHQNKSGLSKKRRVFALDEIARIPKPPKKPTSTGFPEDLGVKLAINKIGEKGKEITSATDEPTRHLGSMDKRGQSGIRQALGETPNI